MRGLPYTIINENHKQLIDGITSKFPPYCDFQFSNLLSWSSSKHPTRIAILNNNLIVEMKEYATNQIINMFMGTTGVVPCIKHLLDKGLQLERVPEEIANELMKSDSNSYFNITEDTNNHDYVLDLDNVANLPGNRFKSKRRSVRAFEREYHTHTVELLEPHYDKLMPVFEEFFEKIAREKGESVENLADELEAVGKLFRYHHLFELSIIVVKHEDKIIGFTINEILHGGKSGNALGCFGKGLRQYKGIYAYLETVTARHLLKSGIKYINLEEDLGFDGLRESKRLWRPVKVLKKFIIKKNS